MSIRIKIKQIEEDLEMLRDKGWQVYNDAQNQLISLREEYDYKEGILNYLINLEEKHGGEVNDSENQQLGV